LKTNYKKKFEKIEGSWYVPVILRPIFDYIYGKPYFAILPHGSRDLEKKNFEIQNLQKNCHIIAFFEF